VSPHEDTRPRAVVLALLQSDLRDARAALAAALAHPVAPVVDAGRKRLLASLEAYSVALTARRLPIPPRLRDELRLHRGFFPSSTVSPRR
jgi:hypothetical protein